MNDYIFKIDNTVFNLPSDYLQKENFTISSSPYDYFVQWDHALDPIDSILNALQTNPKNILLIDANVYKMYFSNIKIDPKQLFLINAIEENKTVYSALDLIRYLEENFFTKGELLLVVGGGIVQDIGAFVGAAYKRGIRWIYFPTTLLSMCDSGIGGKTGLNHNNAKNQVALFSAPEKVCINIQFIKTLRESDIRSGLGEILKLLIIGGEALFSQYEQLVKKGAIHNLDDLKILILTSLYIKKSVIEFDEFEKNHRKSLNYGHTFGHAVEILSNYKIPHGQAIGLGIIIVNKLSLDKGILSQNTYDRIKTKALELLDIEDLKQVDTQNLLDAVQKDKKVKGKELSLVLIEDLGNTIFLKIEIQKQLLSEVQKILSEEF